MDKSIQYMQSILRGKALNKYKQVMVGCKELMKGLAGYQWNLGEMKDVTMEKFWY